MDFGVVELQMPRKELVMADCPGATGGHFWDPKNIFFGGRSGENGESVQSNNSIYGVLLKQFIPGPWCASGPRLCKLAELLRSFKLCALY